MYRPTHVIADAHAPGTELTAVKFLKNLKQFATRAMDDSLKMWDMRMLNKPIQTWYDLPNYTDKTGIDLSADDKVILTGTSVKKNQGFG